MQIYYPGYIAKSHHADIRLKDATTRFLAPCAGSSKSLLFFVANGYEDSGRFYYDKLKTRAIGVATGALLMDQVGSGASPFLPAGSIDLETGEASATALEVRWIHAAFAAGAYGARAAWELDATVAVSGHPKKRKRC